MSLIYKRNTIGYLIHNNSGKETPVILKAAFGVCIGLGIVMMSPLIVGIGALVAIPALVLYVTDPEKNSPADPMPRLKVDETGKKHLSTTVNVIRDLVNSSKEHRLSRDEIIAAKKSINSELKQVKNELDHRLSEDELIALKKDLFENVMSPTNASCDGELHLRHYSLVNAKEKKSSIDEIERGRITVHTIKLGA